MKPIESVSGFRRALNLGTFWIMTNRNTGSQHFFEVTKRANGYVELFNKDTRFHTRFYYPLADECHFNNDIVEVVRKNEDHTSWRRIY